MSDTDFLPNLRRMFIPDKGYTICECDLKGADAQVVAWEANDLDLKAAFRAGLDVHSKNAADVAGERFTSLVPASVAWEKLRKKYKQAIHGTNYGGSAKTIAGIIGETIREVEGLQRTWFRVHPGVAEWHRRTEHNLHTSKRVANAFGFHRIYFDRPDALLPEALAWGPQSTVAIVSFKGALQVRRSVPWVDMLLQCHDSIVFQVPNHRVDSLGTLRPLLDVVVPYPDPLIIPTDLKLSNKSWGHCEKRLWSDIEAGKVAA